jgi:hypothetical protein
VFRANDSPTSSASIRTCWRPRIEAICAVEMSAQPSSLDPAPLAAPAPAASGTSDATRIRIAIEIVERRSGTSLS